MKISQDGIDLIKHFEGCHFKPYLCPANLWTVGYGKLLYNDQVRLKLADRKSYPLKPEHNRKWTQNEVDDLLKKDLVRFEQAVMKYITIPLKQHEFDSIVSFTFNLGAGVLQASSVRSKLNRGDKEGAMDTLLKYCRAGGKVLKGLQRRRAMEVDLFFK